MSHTTGTYLGGVRSVEDVRQRCHVDADTGCWHWRLAFSQGSPRVHVRLPGGEFRVMRGRRAAICMDRGSDLPAGHKAYAADCCKSLDCCNPAHARSGDAKAWGAAVARSGLVKNRPRKAAAALKTARGRWSKLDLEKAREIRQSPLSTYELARIYGVAQNTIHRVKAGMGWAEGARNSSVFNRAA